MRVEDLVVGHLYVDPKDTDTKHEGTIYKYSGVIKGHVLFNGEHNFDTVVGSSLGTILTEDEVTRVIDSPWHSLGKTPVKGERMKMTQENFYRVIAMRDELIDEQKAEISKLKMKCNRLEQKLVKRG